jgi:predicted transcriptional regulator
MANHSQRSKSFLAAEDWQLEEVVAGLAELDSGKMVEHEKVVK